jgi:Ni/Fe-hydrogenase subunit HybB-like protein
MLPVLNKALFTIVAIGIILPTLHQSSLGSLMLLSGPRLNPLWNTRLLPVFFLLTCIAMGYSMVVFEAAFSRAAFGHRPDRRMLASLQEIAVWMGVVFVAVRLVQIVIHGVFAELFRFEFHSILFWIETLLFIVPFAMMQARKGSASLSGTFLQALFLVFAGALYRFDTFLLGFNPGPGFHYFPSVTEILITVGLVCLELAAYIAIVKTFPVLSGTASQADRAPLITRLAPSVAQ